MSRFRFFAAGRPRTKGSTRFVPSKSTGRAVPKTNEKLVAWQGVISHAAVEAGVTPAVGGVEVTMSFRFARPKSHYGTGKNAKSLKESAPCFPVTRSAGDLDKLQRAVLDGLTGVAFADDSQVVWARVAKLFVGPGEVEGVHVTVFALEGDDDE